VLAVFSVYCCLAHRDLPSFPTRRSSDLSCSRSARTRGSGPRSSTPCSTPAGGRDGWRGSSWEYVPIFTDIARPIRACWRSWSRRSEEHTSELQSRENLVCRLLLEKKKKT